VKDPDPLNLRPDDPMVRWRRDAIQREEERAEGRRRMQREEKRIAMHQLRAEVHQEIANLRAEMHQLHEVALEATGQTIGEYSNKVADLAERAVRQLQAEVSTLIERRFAEITARLDFLAGGPSRPKDFKFTNERDADSDPIDLPNPLRRVN
jgi:hypothetical protein